ncbi:MAG TPA: N-6 DNA methylase [Candidatus Saccharimonadales bacterium]|nr:N-6 DNA methylase [Candidatus Saccharimonadales bacterium]
MDELERVREAKQKAVDASKSKLDRNKLGQFATPRNLADSLLSYSSSLINDSEVRFFDPAFGTGSFYTAFLKTYGDNATGTGFEIDKDYFKAAREVWDNTPSLTIKHTDFTQEIASKYKPFNLIVCNPPYSRHHHISNETKSRVQKLISNELGLKVSGLAGMHFYFMLLAHKWLAKSGIGIWLVPSEIVEVNYGKYIRKYLLENVNLLRIHFFEHSNVQFDDALVSSCVIVFKNEPSLKDTKVKVTVGDFANPVNEIEIDKANLPVDKKWSKHLLTHPHSGLNVDLPAAKLGDLFQIKRGIATGKNSFFILDKEQALSLEIPKKYLQNIIPPSRYIKDSVIELDDDGFLKTDKKLVVLNVDLPMEKIKSTYPKLYAYLLEGIEKGVDKTYLASKRKYWYAQESRTPPKYFVRYMSREKADGAGNNMAFIRNESDAISTNSYLMLYEKPMDLFSVEYDYEKIKDFLVKGLDKSLNRFGRTYGGGLVKFEPSELKELPIFV